LQIVIKEVTVESVKKGRTGYQVAHVSYTYNGEARSQKIMSFANPAVFKEIQEVQPGENIDVTLAKDDKGYTQWAKISRVAANAASGASTGDVVRVGGGQTGGKVLGSNYETPEERKFRQLLIVRQSSISNAIEYLNSRGSKDHGATDVLEIAQHFVDFVYGNDTKLEDMDNDIPF
jgi:hypothetical protein